MQPAIDLEDRGGHLVHGEPLFEAGAARLAHSHARPRMREFDASCLTTVEDLSPEAIQAIREHAGVSQAVLASFLNVKAKLVSEWERGDKKPSGPSLKLLSLVKSKGLDAIT